MLFGNSLAKYSTISCRSLHTATCKRLKPKLLHVIIEVNLIHWMKPWTLVAIIQVLKISKQLLLSRTSNKYAFLRVQIWKKHIQIYANLFSKITLCKYHISRINFSKAKTFQILYDSPPLIIFTPTIFNSNSRNLTFMRTHPTTIFYYHSAEIFEQLRSKCLRLSACAYIHMLSYSRFRLVRLASTRSFAQVAIMAAKFAYQTRIYSLTYLK